jgi:site-specific recombinase XerD
MFAQWLDERGGRWIEPDLAAYRDYLLSTARTVQRGSQTVSSPLKPSSAQTHLSTIRGRYQALLKSNAVREQLYQFTPADASPSDRKAFVDEMLTRLKNAVDPDTAKVKTKTRQDRVDSDHVRLTRAQVSALMNAPRARKDNTPLQALRDTAMIALMLCTGIREMELCGLDIADLRQRVTGELVLHVRDGKGAKERAVPYGNLEWCLSIVDSWLTTAGISDKPVREPKPGTKRPDKTNPDHWLEVYPVFRGFYRNGTSVRPGRLTVRAINQTLDKYPIMVDGQLRTIKPHDLRRTYARRLFEENVLPVVIQQNLGHSNLQTTLGYIGDLTIEQRKPPSVYDQPDILALKQMV